MGQELDRILEPGEGVAFRVEAGWSVRLHQVDGQQVADLVSFASDDPDERLSMYMSRAINHTWQLTNPHVLVSTDGNDLWTIEEDTVGENYGGGGYCNRHVNERRSGRGNAPNCEANLETVLADYELTRRSFDADTCFNIFMRVEYPSDGSWVIAPPSCRVGDYIVLRAERRQIVGLSNCPQVLNAANNYSVKRLGLEVRSG